MDSACAAMLSVFIREPGIQGQTKDKLSSPEAFRIVETAVRDPSTTGSPPPMKPTSCSTGRHRPRRGAPAPRQEKEVARKSATRKLRLPGKLADCSKAPRGRHRALHRRRRLGRRLAKQARDRATQASCPCAARS
jgi:topoisomerase-4 subunit B